LRIIIDCTNLQLLKDSTEKKLLPTW